MSFLVMVFFLGSAKADEVSQGAIAAEKAGCTNAACHGTTGISIVPNTPDIAGLGTKYMIKQLNDFRATNTPRPSVMNALALAIPEEDIRKIAVYYNSLEPKTTPVSQNDPRLTLGKSIYQGGVPHASIAPCMGCHGPSGKGIPGSKYPSLSGQKYQYVVDQLLKFQTSERHNDINNEMRLNVQRMTYKEIQSVAYYIQALRTINLGTLKVR